MRKKEAKEKRKAYREKMSKIGKEAGDKVRSSKVAKQNKKLGHDLAKKAENDAIRNAKMKDRFRARLNKGKDPNRFKIKSM